MAHSSPIRNPQSAIRNLFVPIRNSAFLARAEWLCALLFTAATVWLRVNFALHAGGLWRDEAAAVGVATLGSFGEMWSYLQMESSPVLWSLLVRGMAAVGWGSDGALRAFALLIGLGGIGAIWFAARCFRSGPPLVALALFGFSVDLIVWPDTVRANGLGALTSVVALGCLWRLAEAPSSRRFAVAAAAAVVAVQSSYYGALWILAAGLAGAAVVWWRRQDSRAALGVLGAGAVSTASLLPYLSAFHDRAQWDALMKAPRYDAGMFVSYLAETVGKTGRWWWLLALAAALPGAVWRFRRGVRKPDNDLVFYTLAALVLGVAGHFVFFKVVRYQTHQWYYLALLAGAAVLVDAVLGDFCRSSVLARWTRLAGCVLVAGAGLRVCMAALPMRMTNIDLIAQTLAEEASGKDLIVINRWFLGPGYERYHAAKAPWTTLPPLAGHRFHRFDMVKALMEEPDQTAPVLPLLAQIQKTLEGGGRIYFVGGVLFPPEGGSAPIPGPAPLARTGWDATPYEDSWAMQVGEFVREHAARGRWVWASSPVRVSGLENPGVLINEGWKGNAE
jgi:hypothetical protein